MTELLVLSPHLDDAVLSCGRLVAHYRGSVVATLFAGSPLPALVKDWDHNCGFADSDTAVASRRSEDRLALGSLGAIPEEKKGISPIIGAPLKPDLSFSFSRRRIACGNALASSCRP